MSSADDIVGQMKIGEQRDAQAVERRGQARHRKRRARDADPVTLVQKAVRAAARDEADAGRGERAQHAAPGEPLHRLDGGRRGAYKI